MNFDVAMALAISVVVIGIAVSSVVDSNNRARVEIAQTECRQ